MFRSSFLLDKAPVIVLKDVDFENLKALVEYMYKGEANVPQNMLTSFIRTAESLQIRGLAEGSSSSSSSSKSNNFDLNSHGGDNGSNRATPIGASPPHLPLFPSHQSTPREHGGKRGGAGSGGILAARLAAAAAANAAAAGMVGVGPAGAAAGAPGSLFDFNPAMAAAAANGVMLPRHPPPPVMPPHLPPTTKKPRKSERPQQFPPVEKEGTAGHTRYLLASSLYMNKLTDFVS